MAKLVRGKVDEVKPGPVRSKLTAEQEEGSRESPQRFRNMTRHQSKNC